MAGEAAEIQQVVLMGSGDMGMGHVNLQMLGHGYAARSQGQPPVATDLTRAKLGFM